MEGIQALKRLHLSDDNKGVIANKIINSAYFESQFRDFVRFFFFFFGDSINGLKVLYF